METDDEYIFPTQPVQSTPVLSDSQDILPPTQPVCADSQEVILPTQPIMSTDTEDAIPPTQAVTSQAMDSQDILPTQPVQVWI